MSTYTNALDGATVVGTPSYSSGSTMIEGVGNDVHSLWQRHEELKVATVKRTLLLEDVLTRYENLSRSHADLQRDMLRERNYTATYHATETALRQNVARMQYLLNRNPFIAVIIDGDGMIFNETFMREGEMGGREAASQLKKEIIQWFEKNVVDATSDCKVLVRVYASVRGLAEACTKAGLIDNPLQLEGFVHGFTRSNTLFDFVDVGIGKDRADVKVIDNFKLFLFDYHCRQIIVGCSHDNEYARLLEEYLDDHEVIGRVTLLEGVPFEKELARLPYETVKLPGIFRDSKINITPLDLPTGFGTRHDTIGSMVSSFTPRTTPIPRNYSGASSDAVSPMGTVHSPMPPGTRTWAQCATAAAALPERAELPRPTSTQETSELVRRNKKGQRIDPILTYELSELTRVKRLKLCNQHYLGPNGCNKSSKCHHTHTYKPSDAELKTLRSVSRETPCKRGTECEEMGCIYGHRCPFPMATEGTMRGIGCLMGDTCRFPREMHGISDFAPVKTIRVTGLF